MNKSSLSVLHLNWHITFLFYFILLVLNSSCIVDGTSNNYYVPVHSVGTFEPVSDRNAAVMLVSADPFLSVSCNCQELSHVDQLQVKSNWCMMAASVPRVTAEWYFILRRIHRQCIHPTSASVLLSPTPVVVRIPCTQFSRRSGHKSAGTFSRHASSAHSAKKHLHAKTSYNGTW